MIEWLAVVDPDASFPGLVILVYVDLGEERLVEEPPGTVASFEIGGVAVPGQIEGIGQHGPGLLVVRIGVGELFLDSPQLARDAALFGLEQVEGDSSGVVSVEELLTLPGQFDALLLQLLLLTRSRLLQGLEVFQDELLYAVA